MRRKERCGSSSAAASAVLMEGELGVLTDVKKLIVGDDSKAGGYQLTPDNVVAIWPDQTNAAFPLSIAWWINRANGAAVELRLPGGTYNVLNDLTIPANVYLEVDKGATLNIASGKVLTLNCEIGADVQPAFSGEGTVVENYARRKAQAVANAIVGPEALTDIFRRRIKAVYGTASELKADGSLTVGITVDLLGYSERNDRGVGTYLITENTAGAFYKDEDEAILLNNGLIAVKQCTGALMSNTRSPVMQGVDRSTAGSILACALSYYRNQDKLYYGNNYVGSNETNVVAHGLVDGKYQIDCCSFVNLVSGGVFFESSVYAGNEANVISPWGFDWTDKAAYYYGTQAHQQRMLGNDVGFYCYERGYTFKPNTGWNNMQTGDIVFFDTMSIPGLYWHNVGHVALVVASDYLYGPRIIEVQNTGPVVQISYLTEEKKAQITYAARLPYKNSFDTTLAFTNRTIFYEYLADIWALLANQQRIEILFNTVGMTNDTELGNKVMFCEIYKRTQKLGFFRFRGLGLGFLPEGQFDVLISIRNVDVTVANLLALPRYLCTYDKVMPNS